MSHNKWSNKYTTFAVGIGVGAVLALLFAPSSGEETRDYISSSVKKGLMILPRQESVGLVALKKPGPT